MRLLKIAIEGIKNTKRGEILFKDYQQIMNKRDFSPVEGSILGIYGPNGSGKTSVINGLELMFSIWHKAQLGFLQSKFKNVLSKLSENSKISISFALPRENEVIVCEYSLALKEDEKGNIQILSEDLSSRLLGSTSNVEYLPDVHIDYSFVYSNGFDSFLSSKPGLQLSKLFPDGKDPMKSSMAVGINLYGRLTADKVNCSSFLFDSEALNTLKQSENEYGSKLFSLLEEIYSDSHSMYFYQPEDEAGNSLGFGEFMGTAKGDEENVMSGCLLFRNRGPQELNLENVAYMENFVKQINLVLPAFVPGFQIQMNRLDAPHLLQNGQKGQTIEIVSLIKDKDGRSAQIPLCGESTGVQKIVSMCSAIIAVYCNPKAILFVDEFDNGIFERLLGQIIQTLEANAKGQMLFTCHNCRPLEVMDKDDIYFTTMNPEERYIRMKNVKKTNNLRDFYYRALQVGGQNEKLYNETEANEIDEALHAASLIEAN